MSRLDPPETERPHITPDVCILLPCHLVIIIIIIIIIANTVYHEGRSRTATRGPDYPKRFESASDTNHTQKTPDVANQNGIYNQILDFLFLSISTSSGNLSGLDLHSGMQTYIGREVAFGKHSDSHLVVRFEMTHWTDAINSLQSDMAHI